MLDGGEGRERVVGQKKVKGHFRRRVPWRRTYSPGRQVQHRGHCRVPFSQCNIQLDQAAAPAVIHPQ